MLPFDIACPRSVRGDTARTRRAMIRQRAAIVSELHAVVSASALPPRRWPPSSANFIRSHRVRDIVAMCSDARHAFHASDEYPRHRHRDAAAGTAGRALMDEYARQRSADGQWPRCLASGATCAAVHAAAIDEDVDDEDEEDVDVDEDVDDEDEDGVAAAATTAWTWKRVLDTLFRCKRKPDDH